MKIKLSILSAAVLAAGITAFAWPKTEANEKRRRTPCMFLPQAATKMKER